MRSRASVVFVLSRLGTGGAPIQVVTLAREMRRMGCPALLVTGRYDPRHDGDMSYLLHPDDAVRWIPEMTRALYPWQDVVALWRLWRVIREVRPSIVHTHTAKAGLLGRAAAFLAGVPVIVHTFHGNVFRGYFPAPLAWVVRQIERGLSLFTDCICVLSEQQAEEISGSLGKAARSKIRVVPLGLELQPFFKLAQSPPEDSPFVVGWLGRFVPIKNLELLVSVAEEIFRRSKRIRFVVAGDGPQSKVVARAAARYGPGRMEWVGWQQDVAQVIAKCHVLIQTSRNEGTPISLIQGMAAGRPFVSTRAGGVVDMVSGPVARRTPGCLWFDNCVLADPEAAAFASAICKLAESPEQLHAMGQAALTFATSHYGLATLLNNLDTVYTELLVRRAALEHPSVGAVQPGAATLRTPEA